MSLWKAFARLRSTKTCDHRFPAVIVQRLIRRHDPGETAAPRLIDVDCPRVMAAFEGNSAKDAAETFVAPLTSLAAVFQNSFHFHRSTAGLTSAAATTVAAETATAVSCAIAGTVVVGGATIASI